MAATGDEAVQLSQLKLYKDSVDTELATKADETDLTSLEGRVETLEGASGTVEYTGTNGVTVSGTTISGVTAAAGTVGVVSFASDTDFNDYMEIS